MLFGLIVSFVGSLLGVLAWDFPSLVAARLIQAVATGLYFPVVNEALLNLSPKNGAGRLLAINSGCLLYTSRKTPSGRTSRAIGFRMAKAAALRFTPSSTWRRRRIPI